MKKSLISISVLVFFLVSILVVNNIRASAQATLRPVTGFAWSDGIGWISLSSENPGETSTVVYGIYADDNGNLTGADGNPGGAWSDTIGWIKFGGLGEGSESFPNGLAGRNAFINDNGTTGNENDDYLDGWVRACSVYVSNCSGTLAGADVTGGWDGWIKLSGSESGGYQVNVNTPISGASTQARAWGDQVLGWIGFEINVPALITYQCSDTTDNDGDLLVDSLDPGCHSDLNKNNSTSYDPNDDDESNGAPTDPLVDLKVGPRNPPNLNSFVAAKDTESSQNIYLGWTVSDALTCTASSIPAIWSGSKATSTGLNVDPTPVVLNINSSQTTIFKLTCTSASGGQSFDEVKVIGAGQKEI